MKPPLQGCSRTREDIHICILYLYPHLHVHLHLYWHRYLLERQRKKEQTFPVTSTMPKGDPQGRIRIRQQKIDAEGYSGKENEVEAPRGQGQYLSNELLNFWINKLIGEKGKRKNRTNNMKRLSVNRYGDADNLIPNLTQNYSLKFQFDTKSELQWEEFPIILVCSYIN